MYKVMHRFEVQYGRLGEVRKALENWESLWRKRGLTPCRHYILELGRVNVVMGEWEFPSFDQYDRDSDIMSKDEEMRSAWHEVVTRTVQGSLVEELWRPLLEYQEA